MSDRGPREHDVPERELGERARWLVLDAQATDRARRHALRRELVEARRARDRRVRRWLLVVVTVLVGGVAAATGAALAGAAGLWWAALGLVVPAGTWARERLAARRGASAWDWRSQRHVLLGAPAKEVQELDEP